MQQQATFDFPTPPLASVEKMMPHDARIREVYLTGKGIRATAKELGLGKSLVEHAVARMGIARSEAQARNTGIDWDKAVALYKAGHGTKHIAKACGTTNHPSIREGLIKRGVYQANRATARGNETWAGYVDTDLLLHGILERQHNAWWRSMTRLTKEEKAEINRKKWLADLEGNRRKAAERAKEAYYKQKNDPWFKMKQFARNQLQRISRQAKGYAKTTRTNEMLGCSYDEAAAHIQSMLPPEWKWEDRGKVWHIDHIIPLSAFDLTNPEHLKMACHWSNLRPLAATENLKRPRGARSGRQRRSL